MTGQPYDPDYSKRERAKALRLVAEREVRQKREKEILAELIAAAEELRTALEAAMPQISRCSSWQCDHDGHKDCAWGLAHAALAAYRKATHA